VQVGLKLSQPSTTTNAWFDFDNDGFSEEVNLYNTPNQPSVIIRKDAKIIAEWDMKGEFTNLQFFFPADYNHDGKGELYIITWYNDSIFINGIEPFTNPGTLFLRKYVDSYCAMISP
jgi:hypothetical protein